MRMYTHGQDVLSATCNRFEQLKFSIHRITAGMMTIYSAIYGTDRNVIG